MTHYKIHIIIFLILHNIIKTLKTTKMKKIMNRFQDEIL